MKNIRQGFTLIEMIVTISIIAIVTSVGMPGLSKRFAQQKLKQEAQDITLLMNEARYQAIVLKKTVNVHFSPSESIPNEKTNFYWVSKNWILNDVLKIEFDMLGRVKNRAALKCVDVIHREDADLRMRLEVNAMGDFKLFNDGAACAL